MPDFCAKCFWVAMKSEQLPYQIFPGIFSTLDSYGKRLVNGWFERHGAVPEWLARLGQIKRTVIPPHFKKFTVVDEATSIVLRGTPDAVFEMFDKSFTIIDYKTAKFTGHQDELFPMYEAQLNAYAHIGERTLFSPVSQLALVYTEPVTGEATDKDANVTSEGFRLDFSARILPVEVKPMLVPTLLQRAKKILESDRPPLGRADCGDCKALAELHNLLD